jgi:LAO/AO transport system kinase
MGAASLDSGVFVRSMASRGAHGGLSEASLDVADVLEACGMQRVIVETVGVGQTEADVALGVDTVVLVLVPESGDSIQMLKSGLAELADVIVVNKCDRPGAEALRADVEFALDTRGADEWRPPVLLTDSLKGLGIESLVESIEGHWKYMVSRGQTAANRRARLRRRILELAESRLRRWLRENPDALRFVERRLSEGATDATRIAEELLKELAIPLQRGAEI